MSPDRLARRRSWVVGLLLLTACSADPDPTASAPKPTASATSSASAPPTPSSSPSAPPTVTPAAVAPAGGASSGLRLAVLRGDGVELYRVDPATAAAALERELAPPTAGADVLDVTLSRAGLVCASWHTGPDEDVSSDQQSVLACYPDGAPRQVRGVERAQEVALSADGTRLAWAEVGTGLNQAIGTARFDGAAVTGTRRFLAHADRPEEGDRAFTGTGVQDLAWSDPTHLVISTVVDSDDGPRLRRFEVAAADRKGWLDEGVVVPVERGDYFAYDSVVTAGASWALAVQRGSWMSEDAPPSRAVRIELPGGRVTKVLATAADGRDVVAVSGTPEAVFYATGNRSQGPLRVYLRRSSDDRGRPVTGLPADVLDVVAQG